MHVTFSEAELAFQEEVRAFFRDEYPEDIREIMDSGVEMQPQMQTRWQKILYRKGWAGVNWPVEYGGTGWSPVQKYIFAREEGFANAPFVIPFGLRMVGPVIYTFCPTSWPAMCGGPRGTPNPVQAPTWRRSRRAPTLPATTMS